MFPQKEEKKDIFQEEVENAYAQLGQIALQKKQLAEQEEELEFKIRSIIVTKPLRDFEKREQDGEVEDEQRPAENS
jgi:hypothetical protein